MGTTKKQVEQLFLISYRNNGSDHDVQISACSHDNALMEFYCQIGKVDFLLDVVPLYANTVTKNSANPK